MLEVLKKEYGRKLRVEPELNGTVDYFETSLAKSLAKKVSPADCVSIYRENLDMTQEELGKKIGVSKAYVSDWENGRRKISKYKAKNLAALFRISVEHLL